MGSGEADVEEVGFVVFAFDEFDGCVSKVLTDIGGQPDPFLREEVTLVILKDPAAVAGHEQTVAIVGGNRPATAAAGKQAQCLIVAPDHRLAVIVPLPDIPGVVACFVHGFGPGGEIGFDWLAEVQRAVMKSTHTSEDFRTTGGTDRIGTSRPGETGSLFNELIQVGGLDDRVSEGGDGIGTLVVREQQDHIGSPGRFRLRISGEHEGAGERKQCC